MPLSAAQEHPLWLNCVIFLAAGIVVWCSALGWLAMYSTILRMGYDSLAVLVLFLGGIVLLYSVR